MYKSGSRDVYTLGAPTRAVTVELDATRLAAYGMAVEDLEGALAAANVVTQAGLRITDEGAVPMTAGAYLADAQQVAELVIGLEGGRPLYLADVVEIRRGADLPDSYVWDTAPAGSVRAQPIALTALAAMGGTLFILDDPIFNGLAISLIFGIAVSTVLTLVVIPLLYFGLLKLRPAVAVETCV